jgi:hypothetical protein
MGASPPHGYCDRDPRHRRRARNAYRGQSLFATPFSQSIIPIPDLEQSGPGSCLFLFEGRQTLCAGAGTEVAEPTKDFMYLHCGDFRASPQHVMHPAIQGKKIDLVYLDTTYLDPKVSFQPC